MNKLNRKIDNITNYWLGNRKERLDFTLLHEGIENLLAREKQKWQSKILQLVIEDVPHQYQERLLKKLTKNPTTNK